MNNSWDRTGVGKISKVRSNLRPRQNLVTFMFAFLWILLFREAGTGSFARFRYVLSSFGFYEGANITMKFKAPEGDRQHSLFVHWFRRGTIPVDLYLGFAELGYDCSDYESMMRFNVTFDSPEKEVHAIAPEKGILIPVIVNCDCGTVSAIDYDVDFSYYNVKTQLDYRERPNLFTLPVLCALGCALFVAWLVLNFCYQRRFEAFGYAITAILVLYIVSVSCSYGWYKVADRTDNSKTWRYVWIVFGYFYWACLLTFVIIAASGWGTMNSDITKWQLALTMCCCVVIVSCFWVISYVSNIGLWGLIPLALGFTAIMLLARELVRNVQAASMHLRAHMMVIYRTGIDPKTTPVYLKYTTYRQFMLVLSGCMCIGLAIFAALIWFGIDDWVLQIWFNIMQIGTLTGIIIVFRPRGVKIDRYMRQDRSDPGDRESIALEDLNDFDVNRQDDGVSAWDGEAQLPLEPVVVSSAPSRSWFGQRAQSETTYTQQLNPTDNQY